MVSKLPIIWKQAIVAREMANWRGWQRTAAPGVMRALTAFGTPRADWLRTLQHMPPPLLSELLQVRATLRVSMRVSKL